MKKANNSYPSQRSFHRIWVFNSLLWLSSFLLLLFLFSGRKTPETIDVIYTFCFILSLVIPVSINIYLFIPKYLKKEQYISFVLLFVINLVVFAELNSIFFDLVIDAFFTDYYFISYHNKLEIYLIFFLFLVLSGLIWLGEDWIYLNKIENKLLRAEKQQIERQLYYLKGQINPHFLFNALNVLYSLSLEKKGEVSKAIIELSDILRYVIYDTEVDKVSVLKEIELLEKYISFEKNRHPKEAKISFDYRVHQEVQIYPMLLLPLVENSFKHGLKTKPDAPYVTMELLQEKDRLVFNISNNFKEQQTETALTQKGIGLQNIRENLNLIYPNQHEFHIHKEKGIFKVTLVITTK